MELEYLCLEDVIAGSFTTIRQRLSEFVKRNTLTTIISVTSGLVALTMMSVITVVMVKRKKTGVIAPDIKKVETINQESTNDTLPPYQGEQKITDQAEVDDNWKKIVESVVGSPRGDINVSDEHDPVGGGTFKKLEGNGGSTLVGEEEISEVLGALKRINSQIRLFRKKSILQ